MESASSSQPCSESLFEDDYLFHDTEMPNLFEQSSVKAEVGAGAAAATRRRKARMEKLKDMRAEARKRATARVAAKSAAPVHRQAPVLSKKEKRRLDNRRSAELSRKRKRDRMDLLERQVKILRARNDILTTRLGQYEHVEIFDDLGSALPVYRSLASPNSDRGCLIETQTPPSDKLCAYTQHPHKESCFFAGCDLWHVATRMVQILMILTSMVVIGMQNCSFAAGLLVSTRCNTTATATACCGGDLYEPRPPDLKCFFVA